MGNHELWEAMVEKERSSRVRTSTSTPTASPTSRIPSRAHDGYTLEARAAAILEGLGHPHRGRTASRSRRSRAASSCACCSRRCWSAAPDVLLLDEPTNHLDILSIRWLEKFLAELRGLRASSSRTTTASSTTSPPTSSTSTTRRSRSTPATTRRSSSEKAATASARRPRSSAPRRRSPHKQRVRRPLRRQGDQGHARRRAGSSRSRRSRSRSCPSSSRRYPQFRFEPERPSGQGRARARGRLARPTARSRCCTDVSLDGAPRREGRHHRPERHRQVDAAQDRRWASSSADAGTRRVGPRDAPRLLRAGPPRAARRRRSQTPSSGSGTPARARPTASCAASSGACSSRGDDGEKKRRRALRRRGGAARLRAAHRSRSRTSSSSTSRPTTSTSRRSRRWSRRCRRTTGTLIFVSHDRWFVSPARDAHHRDHADGIRDFPGTYDEYLGPRGRPPGRVRIQPLPQGRAHGFAEARRGRRWAEWS